MTDRDRRISDQLVRLVQIVFGLVLAQSLLLHRDVVVDPFSIRNLVATLALGAVYVTTVLSWIDWHVTMELRPYNFSIENTHLTTEKARLGLDLFIVTVYAYLMFSVESIKQRPGGWMGGYLLGFPIIFVAYLFSGLARRLSHGKLATNPKPIIWMGLAYVVLYVVYWRVYVAASVFSQWRPGINASAVVLALGLMIAYRMVRRRMVSRQRELKKAGLVVGVDVDGVLANQIEGIVPRVRARLGIQLSYDDVTEWRLRLGDSDIAKEIGLAFGDSDYVLGMPVHSGARELIDALYRSNRITLLTARPKDAKAWTLQWLDNHGFTFDELVNVTEEKKSFYRSDVLIDDYVGNIKEYLTNTSGTAILVSQPWNTRGSEELQDWILKRRLYVVKGLQEATGIVLGACHASR